REGHGRLLSADVRESVCGCRLAEVHQRPVRHVERPRYGLARRSAAFTCSTHRTQTTRLRVFTVATASTAPVSSELMTHVELPPFDTCRSGHLQNPTETTMADAAWNTR